MSEDDADRFAALDAGDDDVDDAEPEPEPRREPDAPRADPEPADESIDDPAFSYADSNQGPIYARPSTWDAYDDTLELDVERFLRSHDVRNVQKRELHDAALRLAIEQPERLGELVLEARRG